MDPLRRWTSVAVAVVLIAILVALMVWLWHYGNMPVDIDMMR